MRKKRPPSRRADHLLVRQVARLNGAVAKLTRDRAMRSRLELERGSPCFVGDTPPVSAVGPTSSLRSRHPALSRNVILAWTEVEATETP